MLCHVLIDDDSAQGAVFRTVPRFDTATVQDANAHRLEIARRYALVVGDERAPIGRRLAPGNGERGPPPVVAERRGAYYARLDDAPFLPQSLVETGDEHTRRA